MNLLEIIPIEYRSRLLKLLKLIKFELDPGKGINQKNYTIELESKTSSKDDSSDSMFLMFQIENRLCSIFPPIILNFRSKKIVYFQFKPRINPRIYRKQAFPFAYPILNHHL